MATHRLQLVSYPGVMRRLFEPPRRGAAAGRVDTMIPALPHIEADDDAAALHVLVRCGSLLGTRFRTAVRACVTTADAAAATEIATMPDAVR